jgi:hypothetical protein
MQPAIEQRIRERAYEIWEDEGHPQGRDREHWLRARQELAVDEETQDRDLANNPGIGTSPGTRIGDMVSLAGDNTFEGDVMNDTTPSGGINPNQRGRTNH